MLSYSNIGGGNTSASRRFFRHNGLESAVGHEAREGKVLGNLMGSFRMPDYCIFIDMCNIIKIA